MITQTLCNSFFAEILKAIHDFTPGTGDTFKLALYTASADLGANTTVYTASGEVVASGYTAGGITLTSVGPVQVNGVGFTNFVDVSVSAALTARGGLIYNSTKANRAVCVLDFGADRTSSTTFQVDFPVNGATTSLIRISIED
jgi:hypothetical protein